MKPLITGRTNFGKVLRNTEGTRSEVLEKIILKQLLESRSSLLSSQETKKTPPSFAHDCKVGESLLFLLIDPRERSDLVRDKKIFLPRGFPWVLTVMGPMREGLGGTCHPCGNVTSPRKKTRVLLVQAAFCVHRKLKMAGETTSFFELQSPEYLPPHLK